MPFCATLFPLDFTATTILSSNCLVLISDHRFCAEPLNAPRSQFRGLHYKGFALIFFALVLTLNFSPISAIWGEGCVTSMGDMRAESAIPSWSSGFSAKQHGLEPKQIFESRQTSMQREVCKRSYKRALNRATKHGVTWYKGRLYTASQLGAKPHSQQMNVATKNVEPSRSIQRKRLTCFSVELQWLTACSLGLFDDVVGEPIR